MSAADRTEWVTLVGTLRTGVEFVFRRCDSAEECERGAKLLRRGGFPDARGEPWKPSDRPGQRWQPSTEGQR